MEGLGERIRSLRKTRRLTIVEVAKRTGIDQATLSRIENDKMTGTLDSHRRIAKTLGVRITDLYESMMQKMSESKDKRVVRKLESFSHSSGAIAQLLTSGVLQKKMLPVLLRLKGRGYTETEEMPIFSERFVYVVKGTLEVLLDKDAKILRAGESLYFHASIPHSFKNKLKTEAQLLSITTPVSL